MMGGMTPHMLPHLPGVPHLHINRPKIYILSYLLFCIFIIISQDCPTGLTIELRACLHGGGGPQVGEVTRLSI